MALDLIEASLVNKAGEELMYFFFILCREISDQALLLTYNSRGGDWK